MLQKFVLKIVLLVSVALFATTNAMAESQHESLNQMVQQLQQTPNDGALREKIIKLAQKLKPAPAIPEEARRSFVEGNTITRTAKDAKEQLMAVESFKEALKTAPWWGDAYYNLAVAQELAEQLDDSGKSLQFYLLTNPGAKEAREAQDRIYALDAKGKLAARERMVRIPGKNYELGKYEVTQKEWRDIMGDNPSYSYFTHQCGDDCPVEQVSWNDIQPFLQKLNTKTGKQYRLPTEAEWEYACYGGNQTEYCGGNDIDAVAWYDGNSGRQTHPVGQKQANSYGLYDMSGNVWELMSDCWEGDCSKRVLRGGSSYSGPQDVRADYRSRSDSAIRFFDQGFRLARTLP